jgi:S1-C subfamily serine protease
LPIEQSSPEEGQSAFAFGFPQGTLGGTQDTLLGRSHLRLGGHLSGTAPVLAWSETQRFPDSFDSLAGISGGPMLDENGNVIGIIVAASVRRGRNYTVAPEILLDIQRQLGTKPGQQPARDAILQPVSLETSANVLRQDSRIAQTYCIPPS